MSRIRWRLIIGAASLLATLILTAPAAIRVANHQPERLWPTGAAVVADIIWPNGAVIDDIIWPNGAIIDGNYGAFVNGN